MAVTQPLDHPGGLDVNEDGIVIRCIRELQHTGHVHLEWIHTGNIEHALRRGDDRTARGEAELCSDIGPDDAVA
jgi:hypothetical protein